MANRTSGRGTRRRSRESGPLAAHPSPLTAALLRVRNDLTTLQVDYALVGGLAVSARAEPRLTRDVDLAIIADDDTAAENTIRALLARGYRLAATVEQTRTARLATARLHPPGRTQLVVDLLFASSGIEREIVKAAEVLEILPALEMPVARAGHLVAMKLLARDDRDRPQDLDDIRALTSTMSARERRRVATAIGLITDRGYARGRDLAAQWRELTVSHRAAALRSTRRRRPSKPR